jgi:hypothetical protein
MTKLSSLSTEALFRDLGTLVKSQRACTADIVEHPCEVEVRRAHLDLGYSSLFKYCVEALLFSEDEAYRRVEAARLVARFPQIREYLRSGAVSLSVLCALKEHLTRENHAELLVGVSNSSRRRAEEWLACRFPKPDVRESVRLLPSKASALPAVAEGAPALSFGSTLAEPPARRQAPARVEPRSAERFAVHLTVSREVKEQLDLARDLMRHQDARGDVETVIAAALATLVERLQKETRRAGKPTVIS